MAGCFCLQLKLSKELGVTAPSYVSDILEKLAPFATTRGDSGATVWSAAALGTSHSTAHIHMTKMTAKDSSCSGSGSCDVFFPVFPSEFIDPRNASQEIAALANATAWQYTGGMTRLELAVAWPMVIRSSTRETAEAVVSAFIDDSARRIGPNMIKYATGKQLTSGTVSSQYCC